MSKWRKILGWVNVYSFRIRILIGFLMVSTTTVGIAVLGYWYQKQSLKLSQVRTLGEGMMREVVLMQKAEAEFDGDGIVSRSFFETGRHVALEQHARSHGAMQDGLLQLIDALPKAMQSDQAIQLQAKIDSMRIGLSALQLQFGQYADLIRRRGFLSFGIMGEMREIAHALESSPRLRQIQLLQMRRHEKDYFLRRDTAYYHAAIAVGTDLLQNLGNAGSNEQERALLRDYLQRFDRLVALEHELGWTGEQGLRQRIRGVSGTLSRQVDALNAVLVVESVSLGQRYQGIFLALAGLAILLTIALSIYFSTKISDPLQRITRYIHVEIGQQFRPSGNRLEVKGRGEIRDLSNDLNAMVRQIRRQLSEIEAQGAALAEQNAALTALNVTLRETQARQAAMLHVREKVHSIISHDLRAPINGMVGYLNLLLDTPEDFGADDIAKFARKMLQSTMRLSEMMENLLRWSLFHSGELVCNPISLHLNGHVERCFALYGETAAKKEITLHNELAAAYTVWADPEMLDFIMRNLTTNAIKFTKPGGHVRYAAAPIDDGFLEIWVQDDGVGMTMEQVNRILEKGEHVTTSGTQKEKGTGFGLMLCRDFVQRQGGRLTVESSPGHGTQVRFTLPMQTGGE